MPLAADDVGPPVAAVHAPAPVAMDAYAAIASQYVYRGVARRDSPSPTFALTTGTSSGVFADLWGGLVDGEPQHDYGSPNRSEWNIDLSVGYGAAIANDWQASLAFARVVDAGNGDSAARDYEEWRGNVFFRDVAKFQIAYSPDYEQRGWSSWNAELGGTYPLTESLSGEWALGRSHGAGREGNDYGYGSLGLSGSWLHTQWDARWTDSGHGARYVQDSDRAGSRVVVSLSWGFRLLP